MKNAILVMQIIISAALVIVILLQAKGTGLGSAFGGSSEQYRSRRGVEKIFFNLTILLIFLFLITSLINLFVN